jgi:proteasome maturation protein
MEMLRRQFGIAEPVRRGMELKITQAGEWRPAALGRSSGVHKDILEGRDTEIGWEDVFTGTLCLPQALLECLQYGIIMLTVL